MSDTKNVKLGVCQVTFGGVDLGYTKGGVSVEVATETHKVMVDQFGNSEINEYIMGRTVKVTCPLAETTLDNLVAIMPGATLVGGGVKASGFVSFTGAPADGDTITVNGAIFTFKNAPSTFYHIAVAGSAAQAIINAYAVIAQSIDPALASLSFSYDATKLYVSAKSAGTAGNAVTLAKSGTAMAVSGATLTGGTGSTVARVDVEHGIGVSLLSIAKQLVLHPIANSANDKSDDLIVPLAATAGAINFAYKLDAERIFNVAFSGYPDPVTKILFKVGDLAAV